MRSWRSNLKFVYSFKRYDDFIVLSLETLSKGNIWIFYIGIYKFLLAKASFLFS